MKTPLILMAAASLSLALGACSAEPAPTTTGGSGEATVEIPTQEAADEAAAKEITEENADAALDDLEKEILGDS
ncbi:MAG: hypothetical protein P1V81_17735 [Planctomycetota bacterium]|nr:hypothetical protein [Planctomycetota bacterium]